MDMLQSVAYIDHVFVAYPRDVNHPGLSSCCVAHGDIEGRCRRPKSSIVPIGAIRVSHVASGLQSAGQDLQGVPASLARTLHYRCAGWALSAPHQFEVLRKVRCIEGVRRFISVHGFCTEHIRMPMEECLPDRRVDAGERALRDGRKNGAIDVRAIMQRIVMKPLSRHY